MRESPDRGHMTPQGETFRNVLRKVHRASAWILLFGMGGMIVELVLLRHVDGPWQLAPLILLGSGTVTLGWYVFDKRAIAARVLQLVMWLFLLSGVVGAWLHFKGNVVYESESNPGLSGRELYQAAVQGATPTLAPGAMIQLGLAGLIMVYCGYLLRDSRNHQDDPSQGKHTS